MADLPLPTLGRNISVGAHRIAANACNTRRRSSGGGWAFGQPPSPRGPLKFLGRGAQGAKTPIDGPAVDIQRRLSSRLNCCREMNPLAWRDWRRGQAVVAAVGGEMKP